MAAQHTEMAKMKWFEYLDLLSHLFAPASKELTKVWCKK